MVVIYNFVLSFNQKDFPQLAGLKEEISARYNTYYNLHNELVQSGFFGDDSPVSIPHFPAKHRTKTLLGEVSCEYT